MAEAPPPVRKTGPQKDLADSEMAAAAQQLMQLSGEDDDGNSNSNSNSNVEGKITRKKAADSENDQNQGEVSSAKMIRREEEVSRHKKRRYRSIDHIYMATKPVNAVLGHGKKIRS